jgi:RNA polymerase sigma-70 factor (TIGR02943 family)
VSNTSSILNPEHWISTYADALFGYAYSKTGKAEIAEDLVQECFLAGLKSQANFKGNSTEKTWLFSILKFKIADYYRKASTKMEVSNASMAQEDYSYIETFFTDTGEWTEKATPQNWDIDMPAALVNRELRTVLEQCIDKLPPNNKRLILLKLVEEEETEKVCKELNITTTNYWVLIHRAKLKLRACIEKNWINA